jgi:hypothetical protein
MPAASAVAVLASVALAAAGGATELFRLQDPALVESSGMAASARHDGVVWTHPDGGEVAEVMAVDGRGETVATVRLRGVDPYDPEALAAGTGPSGGPALYLGDIGDNRRRRSDVSVFRFAEPGRLVDRTVAVDWFRFSYPDGPHDAEALMVDAGAEHVWVATKDVFGGGLYRAPLPDRPRGTIRLERVAAVPSLVTDGAFLPDGRLVLRSYTTAYLYDGPGRLVATSLLPEQEQGESLAVDGDRLLVGSEGERSAVYAVPVPTEDPGSTGSAPVVPAPEPTGPTRPVRAEADSAVSWPAVGLSLLAAAVAAAAWAGSARARRRR